METVEKINKRLADYYGKYLDGSPMFRVVFSDEQFEKRWTNYTTEGFELLSPIVREMPKYSYIHGKYLLEKLTEVDDIMSPELTVKLSYEPAWVFEDRHGNPLPPIWDACELIVKKILGLLEQEEVKLVPEDNSVEGTKARVDGLIEELFGNESQAMDAVHYGEGIVVPSNFERKQ